MEGWPFPAEAGTSDQSVDLGREGVDEDALHCLAGALESFLLNKGRRGL